MPPHPISVRVFLQAVSFFHCLSHRVYFWYNCTVWQLFRNCSVPSQLRVKMHSKSPSVMAFCLVCLGILAKNMPKHLAGYYLLNSYNSSTKEYDERTGMSSRKSISAHFIHKKRPHYHCWHWGLFLFQSSDRFYIAPRIFLALLIRSSEGGLTPSSG